ncbi:MAG: hypothetical protein KDA93_27870 [Planctomycetaceae bacterium]|nr:hypothetical protein [Planctomycetaceae bacterium]
MSKQPVSPELLSAYFDGEVTAEERAAVTRAAAESPDVQQTLDDYLQLTKDIQSLRETTSSPGLTKSVMTALPSKVSPSRAITFEAVPAVDTPRRWTQIVVLVTTLAAVGLLVMIWPPSPASVDQANATAANGFSVDGNLNGIVLADNAPAASSVAGADLMPESFESDSLFLPTIDVDDAPERFAMAPDRSLLAEVTKERSIPQPGDVVKYLMNVADETVWIPLTVVDVQMTAGEIRYLLTHHGIESAVGAQEIGASSDSNVVILVESDWDKLAEVVADLEDKAYGTEADVESSIAMQKVEIEKKRGAPDARQLGRAASKELAEPAPPPAEQPADQAIAALPDAVSDVEATAEPQPEMLHAQLSARVSDKDVHAFRLEGRMIFSESRQNEQPARGKVINEEQESATAETVEPKLPGDLLDIHASPKRARFVFVIQKSE